MFKKEIRGAIVALILISLGGWLLHMRAHVLSSDPKHQWNPAYLVPLVFGIFAIVVSPLLLNYRRTAVVGYLINGMSAVVGTITMATFSLAHWPAPFTFSALALKTMLSDILILLPKLFLGQMILLHYHPNGMGRMFTSFWWAKHFVYLGAVFALGHFIWR